MSTGNKKEENIYKKASKDLGFKSEKELKAKMGEALSPSDIATLTQQSNLNADNSLLFYTMLMTLLNPPLAPLPTPIYINVYGTNDNKKECKCAEK